MKTVLKWVFLAYIIVSLVTKGEAGFPEVMLILLITALNVFKEKYCSWKPLTFIYTVAIVAGSYFQNELGILLCVSVYDLVFEGSYPAAAVAVFVMGYLFQNDVHLPVYILLAGICGLLGYVFSRAVSSTEKFKLLLDKERRLRYELENTKNRLLTSIRETQRLAEANERNRIAREIHDSAGHKIAGILMQLQALKKLGTREPGKYQPMLERSIKEMSDALALLRDTVYRLKPREELGVKYIKAIIDNFGYCPVDFKFSGNFNTLPSSLVELLASNIREALTNISRYSDAKNVKISIDINENFTRLFIRDDGKGCDHIKEGMGLGGMRERVVNAGGTFSAGGSDGFTIVCVLPANSREGEPVAGTHSG